METLLITDSLFRATSLVERKRYVSMVESCKEQTGKPESVLVFSSQHVSGEKLSSLSGVAALLRFPVQDLDDIESDSD